MPWTQRCEATRLLGTLDLKMRRCRKKLMSPRVSEDSGAKMKTDWTGENAPLGQQVANIRHPPKNYDVGKEAALAYSISKVSNGSKRLESKNFRTCGDWKFVLAQSITLRLIEPFDPHLSWHTTPGCLYGVFWEAIVAIWRAQKIGLPFAHTLISHY